MRCLHCRSIIPDESAVCPACGDEPRAPDEAHTFVANRQNWFNRPRSLKWKLLACFLWLMFCAALMAGIAFAVYITRPDRPTAAQLQAAVRLGAATASLIGIAVPAGLFFICRRPGL